MAEQKKSARSIFIKNNEEKIKNFLEKFPSLKPLFMNEEVNEEEKNNE